jgi:signal transduction histidine kinase
LLAAYGINAIMLVLGTLVILGGVADPKLNSAINSGGDWRLNGFFVGLVIFLIILSEERGRRADRKLELETLRRSSEQAHANEEKLNERSALIDMLTHELKNPLGTIQFSLATLKRALTGDADSLQRVQRIDVSVKRMDDLIEHVADSNKIDRTGFIAQRERMPALELVQELLDEYPTLDRFDVHVQEDAAFLADRKMLTLILENLLSNACKYSVPEASITVAVTLLPGAGTGVAAADVGMTCFEVSNEVAPGQEPDESRLFERYYRHPGVQDQPGMGIGLSLVQSAAEKIGATVGYRRQGPRVFFNVRIPN